MSNGLYLSKEGRMAANTGKPQYLVNNFSETNTMTGWSFGGSSTISDGIVTLTGVNPYITSTTFTVNPTDIICFEMTIALPTPSTTTSGPGLYIGTKYGQSVYVHSFSASSNKWVASSTATTNPYFTYAYNLTTPIVQKHFILGSSVDLSTVPFGTSTNATSYPPRAIQMTSGETTTFIRSGYNNNTEMVITLANFRLYNINQCGFVEPDEQATGKIGRNWANATHFYEI